MWHKGFLYSLKDLVINDCFFDLFFSSYQTCHSFVFLISDVGGLSDQKNNIKQVGIMIRTAATRDIQ